MDSSRRAVESYWRSRMIDAATSDEDKITPVYKLEEICELLLSSNISIVKEITEFILKRLDHKSPVVKQKALRLIKYAVGKSGVEFRREMQRHSVAVRNLSHHKGHVDPLKGDALNKAVRDTAQEAVSAIFSAESSKPSLSDDLKRRIQGFGNTRSEVPYDDKRSFLSEVVGLGSSSIIQGLSTFSQSQSLVRNDTGSYKGLNLRRSLEINTQEMYDPVLHEGGSSSSFSVNGAHGYSPHDAQMAESANSSSNLKDNSREERLLDTIITSGGIRLQPTRDAIQIFLTEAARLDPLALCNVLKSKLQSHMWQVRIKAVCILEAILRQKDYEQLLSVASFFRENKDCLVKCADSPQISLREKANKVLSLLDDHQTSSMHHIDTPSNAQTASEMPDLIDTTGSENFTTEQNVPSSDSLIDELLGDSWNNGAKENVDDDPFSDVSFHAIENGETVDDLFSGLTLNEKAETPAENLHMITGKDGEFFTPNSLPDPLSFMQYNMNSGVILSRPMAVNHSVAGDVLARAPISSIQDVGKGYGGGLIGHAYGNGGFSSPLPDVFHSSGAMSNANTRFSTATTSKEETKTFDFISDHISAARDPKRRAA